MLPRSLETVVPGLREARAHEQRNRALAFAGLAHNVCGIEIVPLTPDHRLELQLVRNAFAIAGVDPLTGDIFQFLWVLHPDRPKNSGKRAGFRSWQANRRLRRLVMAMNVEHAARAVRSYLADQLQDLAEASYETGGIDQNAILWMAADAGFWIDIHGGFTLETYRRTPYLVLQQLHRAWRCNHPKIEYNRDGSVNVVEPQFINRSDAIVGRWQKDQSEKIAEIIRSRHERRA